MLFRRRRRRGPLVVIAHNGLDDIRRNRFGPSRPVWNFGIESLSMILSLSCQRVLGAAAVATVTQPVCAVEPNLIASSQLSIGPCLRYYDLPARGGPC